LVDHAEIDWAIEVFVDEYPRGERRSEKAVEVVEKVVKVVTDERGDRDGPMKDAILSRCEIWGIPEMPDILEMAEVLELFELFEKL
jgi:hypothetical protein